MIDYLKRPDRIPFSGGSGPLSEMLERGNADDSERYIPTDQSEHAAAINNQSVQRAFWGGLRGAYSVIVLDGRLSCLAGRERDTQPHGFVWRADIV